MKAGIKLDRLIHSHIFGEDIDLPPRYSKDWASCGRVIGKIAEDTNFQEFIIVEESDCDDNARDVYFWKVEFRFAYPDMQYSVDAEAPDIPLAICRAALKYIALS